MYGGNDGGRRGARTGYDRDRSTDEKDELGKPFQGFRDDPHVPAGTSRPQMLRVSVTFEVPCASSRSRPRPGLVRVDAPGVLEPCPGGKGQTTDARESARHRESGRTRITCTPASNVCAQRPGPNAEGCRSSAQPWPSTSSAAVPDSSKGDAVRGRVDRRGRNPENRPPAHRARATRPARARSRARLRRERSYSARRGSPVGARHARRPEPRSRAHSGRPSRRAPSGS